MYRSKPSLDAADVYRRRRQCADCRRSWPTVEGLDVARFTQELTAYGLTPADVGLDAPEATAGATGAPDPAPLPADTPAWRETFRLLHELWGDAKDGRAYDPTQKRKWAALLASLEQRAAGGCAAWQP